MFEGSASVDKGMLNSEPIAYLSDLSMYNYM